MGKTVSPVIQGKVVGGKFVADDYSLFRKAFWPHEGKAVELTIRRRQKRRTDPQNSYYWAVVVPMIGEAIGEDDKEIVHDMLKAEHNYEILVVGDKEIRKPKSTAKLNTAEFAEYVERVRRWAAEWLNLYIPEPREIGL